MGILKCSKQPKKQNKHIFYFSLYGLKGFFYLLKLLAVALMVLAIKNMIEMMVGYKNPYSDAAC